LLAPVVHKAENKDIPIIPQAQVVRVGVVRVMEVEEQGWTYLKPERLVNGRNGGLACAAPRGRIFAVAAVRQCCRRPP
jgi:hypothetical protein